LTWLVKRIIKDHGFTSNRPSPHDISPTEDFQIRLDTRIDTLRKKEQWLPWS